MMHTAVSSVLLLAFLSLLGCASSDASGGGGPGSGGISDGDAVTPADYKGPALRCGLERNEQLGVEVSVPTGGYKFVLRETKREAGKTIVQLTLEAPASDERVTQAVEKKSLQVMLKHEAGPLHVCLQRVQRGVEYFVEPPFETAKILRR